MIACVNTLSDELQQAVAWSRPSLLFAVHDSKNSQTYSISVMGQKLKDLSMEVLHIHLAGGPKNILDHITRESIYRETVFFLRDLGDRSSIYNGLNMFRELIVENNLKIIFWLTREELALLARYAPDFWAFRHRVIEFPAGHSTRKNNLPSGVLLWHLDNSIKNMDTVHEKIVFHETLLQNIPRRGETTVNYVRELANLSYYYWLLGENGKVSDLVDQEFKQGGLLELKDMRSLLLNVQAINCFDQGSYHDAFRWIEQALELSPGKSLLWSNHGVISRSAGQARKSFTSLKRGAKLNPASFESWGVLGYTYMSLGKYASAIPSFERALSLHPGSVHFYPAMAVCHSRLGNIDRLEMVIQQILDASKENAYLTVCRDGLLGDVSNALTQLKEWMIREKIPPIFLRRDPNLHFIFGVASLQSLL